MAEAAAADAATLDTGGAPVPERPFALLRRADFRRAYAAVAISELGDAFQYIALRQHPSPSAPSENRPPAM